MIWNPNKECMSRDERSELQGKRLRRIVKYVYHHVPFYRNKMQELDLRPDDIQTIEDIQKLPFTTKKDLRDNYPFGLQAQWHNWQPYHRGIYPQGHRRMERVYGTLSDSLWRYT